MTRFTTEDFDGLDARAQAEIMRAWFLDNYEDPVHSLPYESREGGYIWVYGGPYDAGQVLRDMFEALVSERIIERLAQELVDECPEWVEQSHLIDDDYIGSVYVLEPTAYFDEYQQAMVSHRALLHLGVPHQAENRFYGMVFVNLIAMMEAYLSDAFIGTVLESEPFMRKFVASTPEFKDRNISLAEIYGTLDTIRSTVEKYLGDVVWHRLAKVKKMYRDTLGVSFPDDLGAIFRAIQVRHALVHRNGKIRGKEVVITKMSVEVLAEKIEEFIQHIEDQIKDLSTDDTPC